MQTTVKSKRQDNMSPAMEQSRFHKLFLHELKDIYWAEKNLVKALPKMQKAATSVELAEALGNHLKETEEHVSRLEKVFDLMGKKATTEKCDAMAGLIEEGNEIIKDTEEDTMVRDAALIIAAQKIEHYEIAAYGSLLALAKIMEHNEAARLLEHTLQEEKTADELLTEIALNGINENAAME